jgi:hypothetical protein
VTLRRHESLIVLVGWQLRGHPSPRFGEHGMAHELGIILQRLVLVGVLVIAGTSAPSRGQEQNRVRYTTSVVAKCVNTDQCQVSFPIRRHPLLCSRSIAGNFRLMCDLLYALQARC